MITKAVKLDNAMVDLYRIWCKENSLLYLAIITLAMDNNAYKKNHPNNTNSSPITTFRRKFYYTEKEIKEKKLNIRKILEEKNLLNND